MDWSGPIGCFHHSQFFRPKPARSHARRVFAFRRRRRPPRRSSRAGFDRTTTRLLMTAETEDTAETMAHDPSASNPASPRSRYARRYTAELAERILNEVQSGRALLSVCRDDGIPAYATVYGWVLRDVEGFAGRYARARDIGGRRGARAIQYTTELADRILREVERGRSLHDVCRDDG